MGNHLMEKCSVCGRIIRQCRCMCCNKTVIFGICGDCSDTAASTKEMVVEGHDQGDFLDG